MLVGRCGFHFAFKDPYGLTYRAGHVRQPLGAEQQHHHDKQNQQVPNAQAGHLPCLFLGLSVGTITRVPFPAPGASHPGCRCSVYSLDAHAETRSVTVMAVTSLEVVLVMAGVPLAIMVVLGLLTLGPHLVRARRSRSGRQ